MRGLGPPWPPLKPPLIKTAQFLCYYRKYIHSFIILPIHLRCAVDKTTSFVPATGLRRRFSMQVFRYENTTTVYIHCLIFLCRKNSTDSRCKSGCTGNNINSRKRRDIPALTDTGNAQYTGFYKLDSGQILLGSSKPPPKKEKEGNFFLLSPHIIFHDVFRTQRASLG